MQTKEWIRRNVGIAGFFVSATFVAAPQVSFDLSTPQGTLAVLSKACRERDAVTFVEATYGPNTEGIVSAEEERERVAAAKDAGFDYFSRVLSRLSIRQIDPVGDRSKLRASRAAPYTEAVRVMCTFNNDPTMFKAGVQHVFALHFVRRENKWMWYGDGRPWDRWSYDCSSPKETCQSIMAAIRHRDATGIYDMIDSRLIEGLDRSEFVEIARERLQQVADWKKARDQAKRDKTEPPPAMPPGFLPRDPHWGTTNVEVEEFTEDGVEWVRLWRRRRSGERVAFETFVKEGDQWRWRPKPEYTLWPVSRATTSEAPRQPKARGAGAVTGGGKPDDEWDKYTRDFIKRYKLNDEQAQSAWRILKTCKQQRTQYLRSHQTQISKLERRSALEDVPNQREQALQELEKIKEPIQEIFEKRLKPRLDKLPTRKQRDAVGDGAAPKGKKDGG